MDSTPPLPASRGPGFRLTAQEALGLQIPPEVGAQFESDQLELYRAVFTVVAVEPSGSFIIRRLRYT